MDNLWDEYQIFFSLGQDSLIPVLFSFHLLSYPFPILLEAFDYGTKGNQEKYGQPTPPQYSLQQMRVKTALFYGGRDTLGDPTDVQAIVDALPHDMNVWVQEENGLFSPPSFLATQELVVPIIFLCHFPSFRT